MGPLSDEGLVQLLDVDGTRVADPDWEPYAAHLTPDSLRVFWRLMAVTRAFDAEATSLQRQGELGLWVSCLGQEAAQIGSGTAIREPDYVFPSYREHGVALTRNVDLPQMLTLFRGLEHGSWDPAKHSFHLYTLVIGAHTLHATGYAIAMEKDGLVASGNPDKDGAVVCYFGDGATSQGDVNEAFVFAAVNNAPIVFFIQNNQFAISEPTTRQARVTLAQRADGFGIPRVRVDGNDVIAVHAVTQWALRHARSGQGPVLIEAFTYRMAAHTTSDDPTRYRTHAEEEMWRGRDPLARLEKHLEQMGQLPDEFRSAVESEMKALGKRTRETVKSWGKPPQLEMFDHVYAEPHAQVETERAWFDRYQQSFTDEEAHA